LRSPIAVAGSQRNRFGLGLHALRRRPDLTSARRLHALRRLYIANGLRNLQIMIGLIDVATIGSSALHQKCNATFRRARFDRAAT
jgi:hypothetical protein